MRSAAARGAGATSEEFQAWTWPKANEDADAARSSWDSAARGAKDGLRLRLPTGSEGGRCWTAVQDLADAEGLAAAHVGLASAARLCDRALILRGGRHLACAIDRDEGSLAHLYAESQDALGRAAS